jgi:CRP-like cAMP-binding protein
MHPDRRRGARLLYPFAVMGLAACLAGGKHDATGEVVEDAEIAVVPRNEVIRLLRHSPAAALKAVELLSDDVHRAYKRLREFDRGAGWGFKKW